MMMMMANNATHQAASRHKASVPAEQPMKLFENRNFARSGGLGWGTRACEKMGRGIFFLCGNPFAVHIVSIERWNIKKGCYVNKLAAALIVHTIEICLVYTETSTSQSRQMMTKPTRQTAILGVMLQIRTDF